MTAIYVALLMTAGTIIVGYFTLVGQLRKDRRDEIVSMAHRLAERDNTLWERYQGEFDRITALVDALEVELVEERAKRRAVETQVDRLTSLITVEQEQRRRLEERGQAMEKRIQELTEENTLLRRQFAELGYKPDTGELKRPR